MLKGTVVHGDKRGRLIGYPTANLKPVEKRKVIPKNGVYAVDVSIEGQQTVWRGMMNIGVRPTFKDDMKQTIEVHIIDFKDNIYGKVLTVDFLKRIRDEMPFTGIDALKNQLDADKIACKQVD
jgi:riboflavin kinase/FMN adenylyltransferase